MSNLATVIASSAILPRAELRPALAIVKAAVERKNSIPILSNALLRRSATGGVELIGTDLDVMITAQIAGASADEAFGVTLPLHTLMDIEKKADACDEIAIDSPDEDEGPARLDFQGLTIRMRSLPVKDFPELAFEAPVKAEFTMACADMLAMIDHVESCISSEETRYYLNGVYLHAHSQHPRNSSVLRMVATDGHRLGKIDCELPEGAEVMPGVLVPRNTVAILKSLCKVKGGAPDVTVKVNTTKILFTFGNVTVLSKLIDGTFPDYSRVIPSSHNKRATFDRLGLAKAIKAVSCISSERGRAFKLEFLEQSARVSVANPDAGTASMEVECDFYADENATGFAIGWNAHYVLDILHRLEGERVTLLLNDPGSPTLFRDSRGAEAEFVLMPMRV